MGGNDVSDRSAVVSAPGADQQRATARPGLVLGILSLATFMAVLDLFIVNVAFRDIEASFPDSSLSDQSWVLNSYTICYAAFLVPLGRLADQHSRKRGFVLGLGVFTAASLACALATSLWVLVAARAVEAVGAAALTPASLGLVVHAFDGAARARAVRIWAATGAVAGAVGPVIGGLLVELSWRWVFLINVPVGLLALLGAVRLVRDSHDEHAERTPAPVGVAAVIVAVGALALGLVKAQEWSWTGARTLVAFAVALAGALVLGRHLGRGSRPLIEPSLLRVRSFRWSSISMLGFGAAFAGAVLIGVLWAQYVWGYSPIRVGLLIAPGPLMVPVFAVLASLARRRLPSGLVSALGCVAFAAGCVLQLASVQVRGSYPSQLLPGLLVIGAGTGLALPELLASATADLPLERSTTGSAVVNMARQVGSVIGVSLTVALLPTLGARVDPLPGFRHAWWACAAAALVGAACALGIRTAHQAGAARV
jgi:EmrB/QacA subfamily drug resistance transporter